MTRHCSSEDTYQDVYRELEVTVPHYSRAQSELCKKNSSSTSSSANWRVETNRKERENFAQGYNQNSGSEGQGLSLMEGNKDLYPRASER